MSALVVAAPRAGKQRTNRRSDEWATVVFGTWMITGLFLDGWAHGASKPETFFSPWHGVLYSGFAAGMLYAALDTYRLRSRGEPAALERYMLAGVVVFGAAGVGDMLWHQVFGIETGIEALVSPSHLLLMIGGLLLGTQPLRAAWTDPHDAERTRSFSAFFPTVAGVTMGTALVSFFAMYVSAFRLPRLAGGSEPQFGIEPSYAVASILFTNVLFMAALLLVLRRWTPPAGTFTFIFGTVSFAMTGLDGFDRLPLALAGVIGGVTADVAVLRLRPSSGSPRAIRWIATLTPLGLWASYFATYGVTSGMGWQPELWSGVLVLCALSGFGLSLLVVPPAIPQDAPSRRAVSQGSAATIGSSAPIS